MADEYQISWAGIEVLAASDSNAQVSFAAVEILHPGENAVSQVQFSSAFVEVMRTIDDYPQFIRPVFSDANAEEFFPPSVVGSTLPAETALNPEKNPFSAHVPDSAEEMPEFAAEQQLVFRSQHNKTQAGDTTFDHGLLFKTYPTKEFSLGSLGKFLHPDYGIIHARYVQLQGFIADSVQGQPVGRLKGGAQGVNWLVTNDLAESDPDLIFGFTFFSALPTDGYYGWAVVNGVNPGPLRARNGVLPVQDSPYSWAETGRVGLDVPGRILARKWGPAVSASLPAGSMFIQVEGPSSADLVEFINTTLAADLERITALEVLGVDHGTRIATAEGQIVDLLAADTALDFKIDRETRIRNRELSAIREAGLRDWTSDIAALRIELGAAIVAGDEALNVVVTQHTAQITTIQATLAGLDISGLSTAVTNLTQLAIHTAARFADLSFNFDVVAEDKVFITYVDSINADGALNYKIKTIDYKITALKDYDNTTPAATTGQAVIWDNTAGKWHAGTPTLEDVAVTPGSYTFSAITVDQKGRVTAAANGTLPYRIPYGFEQSTAANQVLLLHTFTEAHTIPAGLTGFQARVETNPAATFLMTAYKNGVSFGTMSLSTAGATTLTSASGATFAAGDQIKVLGPASADATIRNFSACFLAS